MKTAEIERGAVLAERYQVRRRLGEGGMATVFLAEDQRLGREVAVKLLHTGSHDEGVRRFDREARLGAALNHPNLVSIYDTVEDDDGALIVMEYVPGRSLSELAGGKPMRPERALPVLRGVADALDHAHSEGVVHRDVKPGNVLVRDDGVVKLADLGIARAADATQITQEGKVIGTLPYMSPERREGPGTGGPESDVYALAALAHELLAGFPPDDGILGQDDLRRHWNDAPPAVAGVLARGLDPDPGRRQPSAGRLIDELANALERPAETGTTVPFEPPTPSGNGRATARPRPVAGAPRRGHSLGTVIGLAILVLALLATVGFALNGGGDGGSASGEQASEAKEDKQPAAEEPAAEAAPEPADPPAPAQSADAAALNDEGFALINEGRYDEAIPVLEEAAAASEGSGGLTYAYALFNLGNALRLAGRPDEAIPILEQRLEIPNQRETVARELELAREQADD